MLPFANGTDTIMPTKKADKLTEEAAEFDFLDNFLNVLITNMNPGDLSLDSQTSDKLTKLVNSEIESNKDLSGIDLKQFINSLKSELANEKPHKLTLDSIKSTITKLMARFSDLKPNKKSDVTATVLLKENLITNNDSSSLVSDEPNKLIQNENKILEESDTTKVNYKLHDSLNKDTSQIENDSEKLLFNLRKYLTKEEYNIIRKNIGSGASKQESNLTPKVEAIRQFLTEMAGKETDAKSKIVAKANDILLSNESEKSIKVATITHKSDTPNITITDNQSSTLIQEKVEVEQNINTVRSVANSKLDGKVVEPEVKNIAGIIDNKQNTQSTKIADEKIIANSESNVKIEQELSNNTKKDSGEFGKEYTREQNKETIKQRIVKSDISELIGRNSTKKIESNKTETVMRSNFVENAIKNIKMTKSGGSNVARIMLNPRSLGDLTMRISLIGNTVKLYIKADKSETAEHIDKQLPLLKEKLVESGLKVEQVIIESSESDHLANNRDNHNKNEQEELRRQFVKSFKNIAAKEEFDISMSHVAYNNSSPLVGYTQAGSTINV